MNTDPETGRATRPIDATIIGLAGAETVFRCPEGDARREDAAALAVAAARRGAPLAEIEAVLAALTAAADESSNGTSALI